MTPPEDDADRSAPGDPRPPSQSSLDRRAFLKVTGAQAAVLAAGGCTVPAPRSAGAPAIGRASADVVVIGAGAWGGWTAWNLRRMGARVVLVDTFGPGNSRSSSGDETRGFRTSYGDRPHGEQWMRWASEAIGRWRRWDEQFRREFGVPVFFTTGDVIMRPEWDPFTKTTRELWQKVGISHEVLTPDEVRYRWPAMSVAGMTVTMYEPGAGVGRARRSCEVVAEMFRRAGGEIITGRATPSLRRDGRLHDIAVTGRDPLRAEQFVFACGPWLWKMFPEQLQDRMRTPMGYVFYYGTPPGDDRFTHPNLPSFNVPGVTGWPALGVDHRGFRVRVGGGAHGDPDLSDRWVPREGMERPRKVLAERFPDLAAAPLLETRACHYESTISRNFIIDRHPEMSNVWIAGGANAEGFKFGPVVGEYIAARVLGRDTQPALAEGFRIPKEKYEEQPAAKKE
jgi:glycine/D-amino acid oxidase-like deaminating enzyme